MAPHRERKYIWRRGGGRGGRRRRGRYIQGNSECKGDGKGKGKASKAEPVHPRKDAGESEEVVG